MSVEPAWKTYLKVVAGLIPTFLFWVFSLMVVFPKIESLWGKAGFGSDGQQAPTAALRAVIGISRFAFLNFYFIVAAIVAGFVILELWVKPWPRFRKPACTVAAVLLNTFVLLGLSVTLVAALVVADKLGRGQ
jgi:heme/copper-type cytochrome/quinol oxidase subunit 3